MELLLRQGVLGDLEDRIRAVAAESFHDVVVGDAGGDDAERRILAVDQFIERRLFGEFREIGLLFAELLDVALRNGGQEDEAARIVRRMKIVHGGRRVRRFDVGAGVRKPRRQADEHGNFVLFGEFEGVFGQIVAFLL